MAMLIGEALSVFVFLATFFSIVDGSTYVIRRSPSSVNYRINFATLYFAFFRLAAHELETSIISTMIEEVRLLFLKYELASDSKEKMMVIICVGFLRPNERVSIAIWIIIIQMMIKFFIYLQHLHLFVGVWKKISTHPVLWMTDMTLTLVISIFSFGFEMSTTAANNNKPGYENNLSDTGFSESILLIAIQMLANWLVGSNLERSMSTTWNVAILSAVIGIVLFRRTRCQLTTLKDCFSEYLTYDQRKWILVCTQSCLQFSMGLFWLLWAPSVRTLYYQNLEKAKQAGFAAVGLFTAAICIHLSKQASKLIRQRTWT